MVDSRLPDAIAQYVAVRLLWLECVDGIVEMMPVRLQLRIGNVLHVGDLGFQIAHCAPVIEQHEHDYGDQDQCDQAAPRNGRTVTRCECRTFELISAKMEIYF